MHVTEMFKHVEYGMTNIPRNRSREDIVLDVDS